MTHQNKSPEHLLFNITWKLTANANLYVKNIFLTSIEKPKLLRKAEKKNRLKTSTGIVATDQRAPTKESGQMWCFKKYMTT